MKLSAFVFGRDNNLNLIRIIAASAVLITHSFSIATGTPSAEPKLAMFGGMTPGAMAVDVFFVISGFLVTLSLLARKSLVDFVLARVLRIAPALFVVLLLTTLILGPYFTTHSIESYFSDSGIYTYFMKCQSLFFGVEYNLPGVFENNPYRNAVNGSLWSMKHEVRLYAGLGLLWLMLLAFPINRERYFGIAIICLCGISGFYLLWTYARFDTVNTVLKLAYFFFAGGAYAILRERVSVTDFGFYIFSALLICSGFLGENYFFFTYVVLLPYLLLYLAYVPSGFVKKYNKIGDYSYGVYIYAFPIQQSIAAIFIGVSVANLLIISLVVTLVISVGSWHLVEKKMLDLKSYFSGRAKKMIGMALSGAK